MYISVDTQWYRRSVVLPGTYRIVRRTAHFSILCCSVETGRWQVAVLLLLGAVRVACLFRKLRALANEKKSTLRQTKALNKSYAHSFCERKDQRKALYRLRHRAVEAARRKSLEADRDALREMSCQLLARSLANAKNTMVATRFAKWKTELVGLEKKAVGLDGGGSETGDGAAPGGDDGGVAQGTGGSGSGGVVAPSSGGPNPAPGNGNA